MSDAGEEENVSDLLPDDNVLCQRTSKWSNLFDKIKDKDGDEEEDVPVENLQFFDSDDSDENADGESAESIDPSDYEVQQEDPGFNVQDYLNATQKVIAKRQESWHQTGIDRFFDNSFNMEIANKVDGWLRNNCDYFSTDFSRDTVNNKHDQSYNEIKINQRNIVVERCHDSDDSSVDTAKYILSNRKNRRSRVTMTIKEFCYTTKKRGPAPLPLSIKEADSLKLQCCNNMDTPTKDKEFHSNLPKKCVPIRSDSGMSRMSHVDRNHSPGCRPSPKKRPKSMPYHCNESPSDYDRPREKIKRYSNQKSSPQNNRVATPQRRTKSMRRTMSTKRRQKLAHRTNSYDDDSSSDSTIRHVPRSLTKPLKMARSVNCSEDRASSEGSPVRRVNKHSRSCIVITSEGESSVENICKNSQKESGSVAENNSKQKPVVQPENVKTNKTPTKLKHLKLKCKRLDSAKLTKAEQEHKSNPTPNRCTADETIEPLSRIPSDLNLTNVGIINSTAIPSQESMFLCKKNFESACKNTPKRLKEVQNATVTSTRKNRHNNSTTSSRRSSIATTAPIVLYTPHRLSKGHVKISRDDIDQVIGTDVRKKCLGDKDEIEINANSDLVYIPEVVHSSSDCDSTSETETDFLSIPHSATSGNIVEVLNFDREPSQGYLCR